MLNKPIGEIIVENGRVVGVKSEGEVRRSAFSKILLLRRTLHVSGLTWCGVAAGSDRRSLGSPAPEAAP